MGYNRMLYNNVTTATDRPNGLVAISMFLKVRDNILNPHPFSSIICKFCPLLST